MGDAKVDSSLISKMIYLNHPLPLARQERMLPKESKSEVEERSKNSEEVATPEAEKEKVCEEESLSRERRGLGSRKDSVHPTFLMVNKCDHNELRRKFRNYEI